jgi:hypothetical protein
VLGLLNHRKLVDKVAYVLATNVAKTNGTISTKLNSRLRILRLT